MATQTKWGKAQTSKRHGVGIMAYTTSSHGGFHVSPKLNAQIPSYLRREDGWYEEDCDWCLVVTAFPDRFPHDRVAGALDTLECWHQVAFKIHTGENPKQSLVEKYKGCPGNAN